MKEYDDKLDKIILRDTAAEVAVGLTGIKKGNIARTAKVLPNRGVTANFRQIRKTSKSMTDTAILLPDATP